MSLQPYQQRVPIGRVMADGSVIASVEFMRYVSMWVYDRIGGAGGLSNTDLEALIATTALQAPAVPSVVLADIVQPMQSDCVTEMTMQC